MPEEEKQAAEHHIDLGQQPGEHLLSPALIIDEEALNKPLIDEVSEDVQQEVGEFIDQAAEQNEQPEQQEPVQYIAFNHVSKSFGDFDVLKDVSWSLNHSETDLPTPERPRMQSVSP